MAHASSQSPTGSPHEYVLGTNEAELQRLGFQHRVWAQEASAIFERAGIGPGKTVLDVGCGPGFVTLDLAALVGPGGRVIGVDESARFVEYLRLRAQSSGISNVEVHVGDVQNLDLAPSTVDAAYCRWVLCFVPDPEAVVARVASALKPGGVFAVQDYLFYKALRLSPDGRAMEKVIEAVEASWRARAGDPEICRRLPTLMARHGLELQDVRTIVRAARPGTALWDWPASFFRNYLPVLVSQGYLSANDRAAFETEWAEHSANPVAIFSTPVLMDLIAVKN